MAPVMHRLARGDVMNCGSNCPSAVAHIRGGADAACLSGQVQFYQESESVLVVAEISGLPQNSKTGFFAPHIHEGKKCGGQAFAETGGHYPRSRAVPPFHISA